MNQPNQNKKLARKNGATFNEALLYIPCILITIASMIAADISAYLVAFVVILLVLMAMFVLVNGKQHSDQQIRTLSNIIESMIEGDYSLRGLNHKDQAFQELITLVNNLADTLSGHKIEAQESRRLLERIMEQMDAMVIAVNDRNEIVMANQSAHKLILKSVDLQELTRLDDFELGNVIVNSQSGILDFNHNQLRGEHFLFKESFLSEGTSHTLYLITSAERLLLEKERKSWQSLLRVLSHELNNSLSPIASISQSMQKKLKNQDKPVDRSSLEQGIGIINERASSLSSFIASYSQLSHLPLPNKNQFSLKALLVKTAELFPSCSLSLLPNPKEYEHLKINADQQQFEQIFINLFKNADEAMQGNKVKTFEVRFRRSEQTIDISIADNGVGIANKENLFVPFYTTKPQGSGIGLTLSKQIVFNHGGNISLKNKEAPAQGAIAIVSLPVL